MLLTCKLTPDETRERGAALADHIERLDRLKARKKRIMSAVNDRKKVLEAEVDAAARAISSGEEARDVEVADRLDATREPKVVVTVRLDTDEEVDRRPAHAGDLQLPLLRGELADSDRAEPAPSSPVPAIAPKSPKRRGRPARQKGDPDAIEAGSELQ